MSEPTSPILSPLDDEIVTEAARRLRADGLYVKRWFWIDENDFEVPADHPGACNKVYMHELSTERLVRLVAGHLADLTAAQNTQLPIVSESS